MVVTHAYTVHLTKQATTAFVKRVCKVHRQINNSITQFEKILSQHLDMQLMNFVNLLMDALGPFMVLRKKSGFHNERLTVTQSFISRLGVILR